MIFPLDSDDLMDKTMLECSYFALKSFPKATWAYADVVGFGSMRYLDSKPFNVEKMKTDNQITATALIRKDRVLELGGYGLAKRYVNEDWHLWLRMLQKGYFPVHMRFYGLWYRRKETKSLLKEVNNPKNPNNKLRLEELKKEADKISTEVKSIELPNDNTYAETSKLDINNCTNTFSKKASVLIITNKLSTDKHIFDIIEKEADKNVIIITTESSPYIGRQDYEQRAQVFDTTTFLPPDNQLDFIKYVINSRDIHRVYLCNEFTYEQKLNNDLEVIKMKYTEDNSRYQLMEKKYKFRKTFFGRVIYKIKRMAGLE